MLTYIQCKEVHAIITSNASAVQLEKTSARHNEYGLSGNKNIGRKRIRFLAAKFACVYRNNFIKLMGEATCPIIHSRLNVFFIHADTYSIVALKGEMCDVVYRVDFKWKGACIGWGEWKCVTWFIVLILNGKVHVLVGENGNV
eukprot:14549_1